MRLILARTRADLPVMAVAWLVMLAVVTLLSASEMYSDAVARSGLLAGIQRAAPTESGIQLSLTLPPDDIDDADGRARSELDQALGPAAGAISRHARSESFALPAQEDQVRDLAVLAAAEQLEQRARLVDGRWPTAGSDPLAAVVSGAAADRLGLAVGDSLELVSQLAGGHHLTVHVVGIFEPHDAGSPYWWQDRLELLGVVEGRGFVTYGPLFVDEADLLERAIVHRASVRWRAAPTFEGVAGDDMPAIAARVAGIESRLNDDYGRYALNMQSGLPRLLTDTAGSLVTSRAGITLLHLQLALLAVIALAMLGGLVIEQRRADTALLRTRGAADGQLARFSLLEGIFLVLPATLAGPLLAIALLVAVDALGPLSESGLRLRPRLTHEALVMAGAGGLLSLAGLALPWLASVGPLAHVRRAVGRQLQRPVAQRAGVDVALLVMAAIALWQLSGSGAPLVRSLRGTLGVDPILAAAPSLGLLAGALLALRLVPLSARLLEAGLARRPGVGVALGARQLARRPLRYTRAALLVIAAVAVAVFADSYAASSRLSQHEQVAHRVGADVRVTTHHDAGVSALQVADAYRSIAGVDTVLPVVRGGYVLGRSAARGQLLALDPGRSSNVVTAGEQVRGALLSLAAADADSNAVALPLPDGARRLRLDIAVTLDPAPDDDVADTTGTLPATWRGVRVASLVRDASGLLHRLTADGRVGVGEHTLVVEVGGEAPLQLAGIEFGLSLPAAVAVQGNVTLWGAATANSDEGAWQPLAVAAVDWRARLIDPSAAPQPVDRPLDGVAGVLVTPQHTSVGTDELLYSLRATPAGAPDQAAVPALVNHSFLVASGATMGELVPIAEPFSPPRTLLLAGTIDSFPTLQPDQPLAVVALPSLALHDYDQLARLISPTEWWLGLGSADGRAVAVALAGGPVSTREVLVAADELAVRLSDPLAGGVSGALALGALVAPFFAAIGFLLNSAVAARERLIEFAIMRALGVSRRQLGIALAIESSVLLLLSVAAGALIGIVLAAVVLPSALVTTQGVAPVPPVSVVVPTGTLVLTVLFGATLLAASQLLNRRWSATPELGSLLRRDD